MTRYIQFTTGDRDGSTILVEVDQEEIAPSEGLEKIGIQERLQDTVVTAQATFSKTIKQAIQSNVQGFIDAVESLPNPPTEVEITFGLKATGEVGNIAVGKAGGEVNYTVKLSWKSPFNP